MELGLRGKVAIVTGGSMGIGKATAMALASEGVDVAICARGVEHLEAAAAEIRAATGVRVQAVRADMTVLQDIEALVASTVLHLGGVDILVNSAVNAVAGSPTELPDEAWLNHINVKLMGYIRCAREVAPHMKARGWGRIINIGGMAAREGGALHASSGITNCGVANLAKNLCDELSRYGILANAIHPGATRTQRLQRIREDQAQRMNTSVEELERQTISRMPIGRMIAPEDIANLVLFLVSDKASAITGQSIGVDGGSGSGVTY